jgi:NADH-quinone oxidoreductase subunit N
LNYNLLLPEIFLFIWALLLFVLDFFLKEKQKPSLGYVALIGIVLTILLVLTSEKGQIFGRMFLADSFSFFFGIIFLFTAFLAILSSIKFSDKFKHYQGEYFGLILLSTLGMLLLASAGELISLYVALELTTIPLYVLAAYLKEDFKSTESGLKYLILGAVSSALLLYGISLIYGLTGTTDLTEIKRSLIIGFLQTGYTGPALIVGIVFIIAGFGFKLALVPFHMWAPDVYEGAPTPITAYLSVASKAAGLAAFVRVFFEGFFIYSVEWVSIIAVLSALAMIIGNIIAIQQTNIKRMLAYSSIAQVGYILIGVVALSSRGVSSLAFYVLVYLFANMGAFTAVIAFSNKTNSDEIKDYAGLSKRSPLLAILLAIFMLSLVGIPPLAGFAGKYYLFSSAIEQGYLWLVVVAIITSVISLYYYVGIVRQMYFQSGLSEEKMTLPFHLKLALFISVIGVFFAGLYPTPLIELAKQAAEIFKY